MTTSGRGQGAPEGQHIKETEILFITEPEKYCGFQQAGVTEWCVALHT